MIGLILLISQVIIYTFFAIFFYRLRSHFSLFPYFLYLGILEIITPFIGSLYVFDIGWGIMVGGGNIAYSAIIWAILLLYTMERDPLIIKYYIYSILFIQIFLFIYFFYHAYIFDSFVILNPYNLPPDLFYIVNSSVIIGNLLRIAEIIVMIWFLEKIRKKYPELHWYLLIIIIFNMILLLDGILFPILAYPFNPLTIVNGIESIFHKILLGVLFTFSFLIIIPFFKFEPIKPSEKKDLSLINIISLPKEKIAKDLISSEEEQSMLRLVLDLIGHDIRNYNHLALGNLDLLEMQLKETDNRILDTIHNIKVMNHESSRLVSNIINLNKIQEKLVQLEPVDLYDMFKKAAEKTKRTYERIPFEIRNLSVLENCTVQAHTLLIEVFYNILTNAIKHRKNDQKAVIIEISKRELSNNNVEILIADNGIGIPEDRKEEIFSRLSRKTYQKGIGLSIVKMMVNYFNGKIWVENRHEQPNDYSAGSVFHIILNKP